MAISNVFEEQSVQTLLNRLEKLKPDSKAQWGTMNSAQVLAHLNVPYEMALTDNYPVVRGFKRWIISLLAKNTVAGPKPYKKNSRTAPEFIISDERDFEKEKALLKKNILDVQSMGRTKFEGKESTSFGPLTADEWNNLFGKHLDHHFEQFDV